MKIEDTRAVIRASIGEHRPISGRIKSPSLKSSHVECTKFVEQHAEVEGLFSPFRQRVIFSLLSAPADSGAELYLPADAGSVEKEM